MKLDELLAGAKEATPITREDYHISKESLKSIKEALRKRKGCFMVNEEKARILFGVPADSKSDVKSIIQHANIEGKNKFFKVGRRIVQLPPTKDKTTGKDVIVEEVWALITKRDPPKAKVAVEDDKKGGDDPAEKVIEKPAAQEGKPETDPAKPAVTPEVESVALPPSA